MKELLEAEYPPGEMCPECESEYTIVTNYLTSGFGKMVCNDCCHEWVGDTTWEHFG